MECHIIQVLYLVSRKLWTLEQNLNPGTLLFASIYDEANNSPDDRFWLVAHRGIF